MNNTNDHQERSNGVELKSFNQKSEVKTDNENEGRRMSVEIAMEKVEVDPWKLPEVHVEYTPWSELSTTSKVKRIVLNGFGKSALLVVFLYFFVCSLDLLSSSFRLLGGKTAGSVFKNNELLSNPVAGLMISVMATALLQSSSTTTSVAISLVVSNVLEVPDVIPIVMGANIGTSLTNTIVSMGQITNKNDFRRAFASATVHDMFNWLAVFVLLPFEVATGYLYRLTKAIVDTMHFPVNAEKKKSQQFLKTVTRPFTNLIIQIDKNVLEEIALGTEGAQDKSIIKHCCKMEMVSVNKWNITDAGNNTFVELEQVCVKNCSFMLESVTWDDTTVGIVLILFTITLITVCFITLIRTLYSILRGHILAVIKKFINANFPGKLAVLTGYVAMLIGAGSTILTQSSSVVTSALTPLVGVGILSLERVYPLTLGANLGSSTIALIIALSQSAEDMPVAFQVALCHIFFNITGVILFYPLPFMRIPIRMAKFLGNTTAKYRWFGVFYMLGMFILFPAAVFGLSAISWVALTAVAVPIIVLAIVVAIINVLQNKKPESLPKKLKTWEFLPIWLTSLAPYDNVIQRLLRCCKCMSTCCKQAEDRA